MTKSHATDVSLTPFCYEEYKATVAEAEARSAERAPLIEAAGRVESAIRAEVDRLYRGPAPRETVTGGSWGEFTGCLANAGSFAGQAFTAAANGDPGYALSLLADALAALEEAKAML